MQKCVKNSADEERCIIYLFIIKVLYFVGKEPRAIFYISINNIRWPVGGAC